MHKTHTAKAIQTIVIGGGQAGLAVGHYLTKHDLPFLILDANERAGDAWRNRWDSLRLFNPARYAGLPGLPFPACGDSFPTKDQIADYLADYVEKFQLPVRNGIKVDRLWQRDGRFVVHTADRQFEAKNVVVAMSNYQRPKIPSFARDLDADIVQLHSHDYRNASQLQDGPVLVVGVGNSGADIAIEVARSHETWISGKENGHIPWPIESFISRFFIVRLVRFLGHHVLTVNTPIGRRLRPKMVHQASPLVRVKPQDLVNAGIISVPRTVGTKDGYPLLADGQSLKVKNVIWCTGYHHDFPWIDLPIFDEIGDPMHQRGIVAKLPGIYFVGLHFLYSMTSATLLGVGRDAKRIADEIYLRQRSTAEDAVPEMKALSHQTKAA